MISIGFDVGGTNTKIAVIDDNKRILNNYKIKTPISNGYEFFIDEIIRITNDLRNEFKNHKLKGVCIAIAGDVDNKNGILRYAPNLNGWKNKRIKDDLEKKTDIKFFVENDANMASWGVYDFELERRFSDIVVFTLGTGVGGGIILNNELYSGFTSTAGELGHIVIEAYGEKCKCGNYGCLEAYCGSYALLRDFRRSVGNVNKYLRKYDFINSRFSPEVLYELAKKNDKIALKLWKDYGRNLGTGIGNILMVLNPQCIVLSGGVSRAWKVFLPSLRKRLSEYGIKTPYKNVKIVISRNQDIGVLGSALFVFNNQ